MNRTTRDVPLPRALCWPGRQDNLDAGSLVYVMDDLPGDRVRIMSLAGVLEVPANVIENYKPKVAKS